MVRLRKFQKFFRILGIWSLASVLYFHWGYLSPEVHPCPIRRQNTTFAPAAQQQQDPSSILSSGGRTAQTLLEENRTLSAGRTRSVLDPAEPFRSGTGAKTARIFHPDKAATRTNASSSAPRSRLRKTVMVRAVVASDAAPPIRTARPSSTTLRSDSGDSSPRSRLLLHGSSTKEDRQPPKLLCVRFTGRLGNELFEYASTLGLALTLNRTPVFLGSSVLILDMKHFQVSPANLSFPQLQQRCQDAKVMEEDSAFQFKEEWTQLDPQYDYRIGPYVQSYRYFEHHEAHIRQAVAFNDRVRTKADTIVKRLRQQYASSVLVGVHVRHGDMASKHNQELGYPLASPDYVNRSLAYFTELFPQCVFVVASDSLQWCKDNFPKGYSNVHFLSPNEPAVDMAVLASTDHVIISFGSFSWWIGYLNPGKTVYMKDFIRANTFIGDSFNPKGRDYIYPGWIPL